MCSELAGTSSASADILPRLESEKVRVSQVAFHIIDLMTIFNNDAISSATNPGDGKFNVWGNNLPAEELPNSHHLIEVHGVPFRFPPKEDGALNNIVCRHQYLRLPTLHADWLHLLTSSERRTEDTIYIHYDDGAVDPEWIRVSDFWPASGHFGELLAFRCSVMHYPHHVQPGVAGQIWMTRIPIVRRTPIHALRLPDNSAIHIFAMTLEETRH